MNTYLKLLNGLKAIVVISRIKFMVQFKQVWNVNVSKEVKNKVLKEVRIFKQVTGIILLFCFIITK
jgi:hypothetical protein